MSNISSIRRLIGAFRSRSVVFDTRTILNKNKTLVTWVHLEFNKGGTIGFRTVIDVSASSRALSSREYDELYTRSQAKLTAHLKTLEEFIRVLDEAIDWAKAPKEQFFVSVYSGHNPFFAHGARTSKEVKLEFFGRGISDISIGFEHGKPELVKEAILRLEALKGCLVEYQDIVQKLSIYEIISAK